MALSRKSRRATKRSARKGSRKSSRKQRGGASLTLNIAQLPLLTGRPPARGSPAAKALSNATNLAGNITLVGAAPQDITGFSSPAKSQKIMFTTATPPTSITASVKDKTVKIPITVAPAVGTGTGIRADVNGNNVTIFNVSSGSSSLNILGGDKGDFTLNIT